MWCAYYGSYPLNFPSFVFNVFVVDWMSSKYYRSYWLSKLMEKEFDLIYWEQARNSKKILLLQIFTIPNINKNWWQEISQPRINTCRIQFNRNLRMSLALKCWWTIVLKKQPLSKYKHMQIFREEHGYGKISRSLLSMIHCLVWDNELFCALLVIFVRWKYFSDIWRPPLLQRNP